MRWRFSSASIRASKALLIISLQRSSPHHPQHYVCVWCARITNIFGQRSNPVPTNAARCDASGTSAVGHQRHFKQAPRTSASPPIPDVSLRRTTWRPIGSPATSPPHRRHHRQAAGAAAEGRPPVGCRAPGLRRPLVRAGGAAAPDVTRPVTLAVAPLSKRLSMR